MSAAYEDSEWFADVIGDHLERIALDEMKGDDFPNWQNLYRGMMETLAQHEPFSLAELMDGYDEAPEGLSGWPWQDQRIAAD